MTFGKKLLAWYEMNKRDLPWRETSDPYRIWLSEIILQQTRIDQGLPYYQKFISKFPKITDLAEADEQEVLKLWQGLGYYSRARNLHETAREIVSSHGGIFPGTIGDLKKLKGVGDYTAAAIAAVSFGLPYPVVDGNVIRFFSRHFGIEEPAGSARMKNRVREMAGEMIKKPDPGMFNQAIMEFGALFCRPADPPCSRCIFRRTCIANKAGLVKSLPVKSKKAGKRTRYFNYLVILPADRKKICLCKREGKDIWKNLYEFPLIETLAEISAEELKKYPEWRKWFSGRRVKVLSTSRAFTHILTHQVIVGRFIRLEVIHFPELPFEKVKIRDLEKIPVSRLIEKYLSAYPL